MNIPPGVTDGQTIRLPGKGGRGTGGAPPGDLYLLVHIEPDERYRLLGRDLEVDLPLSPSEAALGTTVPVEGPGGTNEDQGRSGHLERDAAPHPRTGAARAPAPAATSMLG